MKIDSHQHFWLYEPREYSWIKPDMRLLQRDYTPPDVYPEMESLGYRGCVVVQARQTPQENRFLVDLAERFDYVLGIVGWVDLRAEDRSEHLARWADHSRFKGVRHLVQDEPPGFTSDPEFCKGIRLLESFGLTYDLLVYAKQLPEAIGLVRSYPEQKFVLDHAAKPSILMGEHESWARNIQSMARLDNVWCKLSGLVTEADHHAWTVDDLKFYVDTIFEAFGTDRIMIGSDWPVCRLAGEYEKVMRAYEFFAGHLTDSEQAAVFGDTAKKFYGL